MDVIIIPVKGNSVFCFAFGVSCFFSSLCPPGTAAAAAASVVVAVAVGCCFGRRKLQFPKTPADLLHSLSLKFGQQSASTTTT